MNDKDIVEHGTLNDVKQLALALLDQMEAIRDEHGQALFEAESETLDALAESLRCVHRDVLNFVLRQIR
jgi:hypothetical protein